MATQLLLYEKKIRQNLKTIIKQKGLTQKVVAKRMNYGYVSFSQLMTGKIPLNEKLIRRIADACEVDPSEFFKDIYIPKRIKISRKPTKLSKKIDSKTDRLIDYIERLDSDEADNILDSILNLFEKFKISDK